MWSTKQGMYFSLLFDAFEFSTAHNVHLHNLYHHFVVLYCVVPFICRYFLHAKQVFVMGFPQVLWLFICLSVGYIFVCPFLFVIRTSCSVKFISFPTLCLINVYHGLLYVPDNVCKIKSENFLTLHYWIVVAPIFINFKYRRWKLTTHMPKIVVRSQNQHFLWSRISQG